LNIAVKHLHLNKFIASRKDCLFQHIMVTWKEYRPDGILPPNVWRRLRGGWPNFFRSSWGTWRGFMMKTIRTVDATSRPTCPPLWRLVELRCMCLSVTRLIFTYFLFEITENLPLGILNSILILLVLSTHCLTFMSFLNLILWMRIETFVIRKFVMLYRTNLHVLYPVTNFVKLHFLDFCGSTRRLRAGTVGRSVP
jgi:hypothetical protein